MMPVDTATLAAHLGITTGDVRLRVHRGTLAPIGRWRTGRRGRPTMWFDLDTIGESELTQVEPVCVNPDQRGATAPEGEPQPCQSSSAAHAAAP
jgi:hypothetical protein